MKSKGEMGNKVIPGSWWSNGERHRDYGPAEIWSNGTEMWYQNGKLHRLDGPAKIYPNGIQYWYINGRELPKEWFEESNINRMNPTKEDLLLIKLTWG